MTNEEAITYLMNNSCYECSYGCESAYKCRVTSCAFKNAIKESIAALEKQDRYRWHDLRKDPEDLPEDYDDVMICIHFFEMKKIGVFATTHVRREEVCVAMHVRRDKKWIGDVYSFNDKDVVAWREIEPFEEVER